MKRSLLAVALFGILFSTVLLQNLPFTFGDDLNVIHTARTTSWIQLLRAVLNPITPAWYVHGAECLLTTRAFETLLFKLIFELFGYEPNAFLALKILSYTGSGILIFLFVVIFTQRPGVALGASFFFYLLPPIYRSVSWITDLELTAQMFLLLCFFVFFRTYHARETESPQRIFLRLFLLVASAWLGMKLKETVRIIPFVLLGFMVLHQRSRFLGWFSSLKNRALFASACFLLIPVIPWRLSPEVALDSRSHTAIFHLNLPNVFQTLSPLVELLLPLFALVMILLIVTRLQKPAQAKIFPQQMPSGAFLFLTLWILPCLLGFALNFNVENNARYLTTPLIPLTILIFSLLGSSARHLKGWRQHIFNTVFVVLLVIALQRNLDEVVFLRNYFGGVDIADYALTKKIYEDRFGSESATWQDLDDFWRGRKSPDRKEFREIRIKEWDRNMSEAVRPENLAALASKWGAAYVLSFNDSLYTDTPEVQQIFRSTTANQSLYATLLPKIKKKTHRAIYLYKYTAS